MDASEILKALQCGNCDDCPYLKCYIDKSTGEPMEECDYDKRFADIANLIDSLQNQLAESQKQYAESQEQLKAAIEDIHTLNTICLAQGSCSSCCGNQNDDLLFAGCEFCNKSGVGCWVEDPIDPEKNKCAAFEWRGVQKVEAK